MKQLSIKVYTDGACSGNPGPGGWSALLLVKGQKKKEKVTIKGGEKHTTNNRMELTAVIEALEFIQKNLFNYKNTIKIVSDSSYVVNSINNKHLHKWCKNGWKTTKDSDVLNRDLWERAIRMIEILSPVFIKVKGHSGDKFNDYVDEKAVEECNKYKQLLENL
jgi:ribonuclease HI